MQTFVRSAALLVHHRLANQRQVIVGVVLMPFGQNFRSGIQIAGSITQASEAVESRPRLRHEPQENFNAGQSLRAPTALFQPLRPSQKKGLQFRSKGVGQDSRRIRGESLSGSTASRENILDFL